MKLKNKLLMAAAPIATVAALTPVAMLTSCGGLASLHLDIAKIEEFEPSEDQWTGTYNPDEMTNEYFEKMSAKPALLCEDIIIGMLLKGNTDPEVTGYANITITKIDKTNKLISCSVEEKGSGLIAEGTTLTTEMKYELTNIPFACVWNDTAKQYVIQCSWTEESIVKAQSWKINLYNKNIKTVTTTSGSTEMIEVTNVNVSDSSSKEDKTSALKKYLSNFTIYSWYMKNITKSA